ncbi:MAG: hypothetical protein AAGE65_07855 [Planctomycetota bacterium]
MIPPARRRDFGDRMVESVRQRRQVERVPVVSGDAAPVVGGRRWGFFVEQTNDTLTVDLMSPDGSATGVELVVAKVPCMRHAPSNLGGADSMVSLSPTAATASDAEGSEDWEIRPLWVEGELMAIDPVPHAGIEVEGEPLRWMDGNICARVWSEVTADTAREHGA